MPEWRAADGAYFGQRGGRRSPWGDDVQTEMDEEAAGIGQAGQGRGRGMVSAKEGLPHI